MFEPPHVALPDELVDVIDGGRGIFRIERIVSRGHVSPPGFWYDQDEDEWVWLLGGAAILEVEVQAASDQSGDDSVVDTVELAAGDYLLLPAHMRHRVSWTDPDCDTVWLSIFLRR